MSIDDEKFDELHRSVIERLDRILRKLERSEKLIDCLEGDKLLDNYDMCELLKVTKRTLARYRQKKLITYYLVDGRAYYKSSEIKDFLKKKGLTVDN